MKDIYLKFGNPAIKGESADKDHSGWIEIDSWSHAITQPRSATASTAGGHTGGTTFDEATIEFMRSDGEGNRVKYLEVKLKYVIISSIAPSVVGEGLPTESFSLKYAAVQWKYTQQKVGGGQGGNAQGAWSLTKNDKTYAV
jgi:type VI secretion system secreted protein Hcp